MAQAPDPKPCQFALVQQVSITSVQGARVSFKTRTQEGTLGEFTATTEQILASPPTGAPTPVAWRSGAVGNLYLAKPAWEAAAAGGGLYGFNVPGAVLFKYPLCAPFRGIEPLDLIPSSVKIYADGAVYDLLGANAGASQQINWNAATPISIVVNGATKSVWPTKIEVTGVPKAYPDLPAATVDILDCKLADFVQSFGWQTPKAAISVRLNEQGFEAFNIVQEAIHQYAAGAAVTYPGALVDDLDGRGGNLADAHANALAAARDRVKTLSPAERAMGKRTN